jgi:hypothetical protein
VVNVPGGGAETVLELPFRESAIDGDEQSAAEPALVEGPAA